MACGSCGQARLGASNLSVIFLSSLRGALGLGQGGWDRDAHTALWRRLAGLIDVRSDLGMTVEQLTAVPWGERPDRTAFYAAMYPPRYIPAGDAFWTEMGITAEDARTSMSRESGAYYLAAMGAADRIGKAEGLVGTGPVKDTSPSPMLIGLGLVALLVGAIVVVGR